MIQPYPVLLSWFPVGLCIISALGHIGWHLRWVKFEDEIKHGIRRLQNIRHRRSWDLVDLGLSTVARIVAKRLGLEEHVSAIDGASR